MYANVYDTRQAQMSRGTPSDFRHGPDLPITRRNLRWIKNNTRLTTTSQIVRHCVTCPEDRHTDRVLVLGHSKPSGRGA